MRIYTRRGDGGDTGLAEGGRRPKWDPRVEALGALDELNCHLGLVRLHSVDADLDRLLQGLQEDLFALGAELASPSTPRLTGERVAALEAEIDRLEASLPPLRGFVLPGGGAAAAHCHLARAVCRRAERRLFRLARDERLNSASLKYLNRLSDLLFVLARHLNRHAGRSETLWGPGAAVPRQTWGSR